MNNDSGKFTIEGLVDGTWCREHVGANESNLFDSREAAEAELPELARVLDCDVSELRVVEMAGNDHKPSCPCHTDNEETVGVTTYYAVCNVYGPISVKLDAKTETEALTAFEELDGQAVIDSARSDLEDELGIDGEGMKDAEFDDALRGAGAKHVRCLNDANIVGGWNLWSIEVAS